MKISPKELIRALRETDSYIEEIFMEGSCYQFHLFLKRLFPQSIPYLTYHRTHIVTKIDGSFYDILGQVGTYDTLDLTPLTKEDLDMVKEWSFANYNWIKLGECSNCEEPIII